MRTLRLQRVPQASLSGSFSPSARSKDFHILLPCLRPGGCLPTVLPLAVKVTAVPLDCRRLVDAPSFAWISLSEYYVMRHLSSFTVIPERGPRFRLWSPSPSAHMALKCCVTRGGLIENWIKCCAALASSEFTGTRVWRENFVCYTAGGGGQSELGTASLDRVGILFLGGKFLNDSISIVPVFQLRTL